MNYESLFILIVILLFIITFCIHREQLKNKNNNNNKQRMKIPVKSNLNIMPPGKGFAEYIPPATKCNPEDGCHAGSYVDFSTKNL
tara:strand:- start:2715 stop:2969 length:255 start_codon:yes stop_codon:yes gene_type:complete